MNSVYLLIGANLGDREDNIDQAKQLIQENLGSVVRKSSVYETASWGITDQPDFLNQVLQIETELSPRKLLGKILSLEQKMGRVRTQKNASRIIDIDILFYNDDRISEPGLEIPHPEIENRRFVLEPLAELFPHQALPSLHKFAYDLLLACKDFLEVKLFK